MREPTEMELRVAMAVDMYLTMASAYDGRLDPMFIAIAAIRAMREPTKDMILAGEDAYSDFEDSSRDTYGSWNFVHPGHESATWMAMVDRASPPDESKKSP